MLDEKGNGSDSPGIMVLKFADSKIPEFKEVRNKDYILYGAQNDFPEYLTMLYNKSAKHNAIINGKCNYILGGGFSKRENVPNAWIKVNRTGESLNELMQKTVKDIEIYGGFRWIIIWDLLGRSFEVFHEDFFKFRTGKEPGTFFYKKNWKDNREDAIPYNEFNPDYRRGAQVFAYNEYRPGCEHYPLPGYIGANNYIEVDIEISKYHLSSIRNGMFPSKLIQFFDGEPPVEAKKEIEGKFKSKFNGAEKAGSVVLVFNKDKNKSVEISDLSATDLDKQFEILNKTCQQEIFTGHQVVSPMLFGIKTEGQLGGTTELKAAYEIFINTYAKPKQYNLEKIVNYFTGLMGKGADYYIDQLDPIGIALPDSAIEGALKPEEIREKLGLPPLEVIEVGSVQKTLDALANVSPLVATKILDNLTRNEIRSLANLSPVEGGDTVASPLGTPVADGLTNEEPGVTGTSAEPVNDAVKNLTAKQHQQLLRIIRQYSKGQLTREAATVLLKTGLGLTAEDISALLGIEDDSDGAGQDFSSELDEDAIVQLFADCGELKADYHIVKKKAVKFSSDDEASDDELSFFQLAFDSEVANAEADILRLIAKDRMITPELIAEAIGSTPEYVTRKLASLTKKGLLKSTEGKVGQDIQIERTLTKPLKDVIKTVGETDSTEISIKYSYEGPEDDRNRAFCKKMMQLGRLYSRYEIEQISQRLGYSVFDRRGGFWQKPDGTVSASCRHHWQSNVVVKKGKG